MCKDKSEIKNRRQKPTILAAPLFASNRVNVAINRALLAISQYQTEQAHLFRS